MKRIINADNLDEIKEVVKPKSLDGSGGLLMVPNGFLTNELASGLEVVLPNAWQVGADHQLMKPTDLLPDHNHCIPNVIGQNLRSCGYGFQIGRFDNVLGRFTLWEVFADEEPAADELDILVYSLWDRTVGAPGLRAGGLERAKSYYRYYHDSFNDAAYKTSGVQVFVFSATKCPQLRNLVQWGIETKKAAIAYADQCMQQFEDNRERIAKVITGELNGVAKKYKSIKHEFVVYTDPEGWTSWAIKETSPKDLQGFAEFMKLKVIDGNRYWHDQAGENQCREDMKDLKKRLLAQGEIS